MSDRMWELIAPLIPEFASRSQGGGTGPLDSRDVFTAVVFVLTSECAWRRLPASFEVSPATAHRRFASWSRAGLWERLRQAVLEYEGIDCDREWVMAVVEAAMSR
ncbi:transposase [Streptomyces sp. TRM 70351]|uniref:transposase n=1 Tax=Streptomyces sp. TRM 70351 TaxID=3116552 RepID=UPI002E7C1D2C|nr:transposase [Streptomyces sp. TRM 70351]MEE1928838.1 transposase [Streptomyces sp. TRM 70351]